MRDDDAERPTVTEDELHKMLHEALPKLKRAFDAPPKIRHWDMSFGPVRLEAGAQEIISIQTRAVFRGEVMINTGDNALIVRSFAIDRKPLFEDLWNLPVAEFCEKVSHRNKETPMVAAFSYLDFKVENTGSANLTFAAALIGHVTM